MPCNVVTIDSEHKKGWIRPKELEEGMTGRGEGDDTDQDIPPLGQWEDGEGELSGERGVGRQSIASHGSAMTESLVYYTQIEPGTCVYLLCGHSFVCSSVNILRRMNIFGRFEGRV